MKTTKEIIDHYEIYPASKVWYSYEDFKELQTQSLDKQKVKEAIEEICQKIKENKYSNDEMINTLTANCVEDELKKELGL